MRKAIILMAACLLGAASAFAVPAKRVPTTITQSDGTKVTITMMGDEWSHSYVTSDFKTVGIGNDGDVYYRTSSGLSNVRAHEIVQRNAAELGFLSKNTAIMGLDALTKSNPRSKARSMSYTNPMKVGSTQVPTTGTPRVPVIVIEYSDKKCSNPLSTFTSTYTSGSSSVYQYFNDQSNGLYSPQYDVYGIYNLNKTRATYGGNDSSGNDVGVAQMVYDAVIASNADIDWTQYDNDGDGEADVVIVVYAGVGEAQASSTVPNSIWPCQWTLASGNYYGDGPGSVTLDGIKIDRFGVFNEINGSKDNGTQIDGIGTFCHEFSHCLGLPDFYDTGSGNYYYGIGSWSLMDYGSYNNNGYTPIGYSAYEKNFMGWINLLTPTENSFYTLPKFNQKSSSTDIAYKVVSPLNSNEYYILENRAQHGWDSYIADEGLMVTHVTYVASRWSANTVNKQAIQLFTIIPADNTLSDYNEETDLYGESNHSLTDATTPAAKLNMNSSGTLPTNGAGYMGKPLTEINLNSDGTVSFWYIKGNEPHFAPVLNDATNVQNTSFTASWTDETDAQYVSSYDLQVNAQGSSTSSVYSLVSSASSLSNGDKIIIVDETASKAAGAISNNVLVAKDVTISNSSITDPEDVEVFTLVANGANWKLANSEGQYLTSTTAKKVSYTNSGTSVSISISSGSATINFGTAGKILYNNGSPRFTTYTSNATSTMRLPKIYKLSSGASSAPLRASETGDANSRTITGITAKSYTVSNLSPGTTYQFKVRANYADGSQSDWTATKSVTLSGTAELNPFIVADEAINFSEVTVGESSTKALNILAEELKGDVTLTLNDTNNVFSLATTTVSKADAEEGAAVNVTFAPAAAQNYSATVTVSSEDAEPVVVTLSGTGLPTKETPQFTGDATEVTTSSFNVEWNAVDYAASYTLDVTRTGEESYVYALVTNANDLADGDKIIIVSTSKGKAAGALSGTFLAPENVTVSNDVISELPDDVEVFTLVADGSNWKLANSEGQYLTSTTAKTVSYTAAGTSTTVTISGGDATISFGDAGRILYNNTNPRFTTYTSNTSSSMLLPQIYKRVPASANASETGDEAHKVITGITNTNYTVEGLTAGATYSCKVKAVYLDETESEWSTALSVTLEEEQPVPTIICTPDELNFGTVYTNSDNTLSLL
ncbi:MAG: M6 family metalloprotease domain-containing protein, partial [Muribaculaceae bacterium]|nr:M6 family metalloprotease domain-containing protein [Muribaculaceae bacterium]